MALQSGVPKPDLALSNAQLALRVAFGRTDTCSTPSSSSYRCLTTDRVLRANGNEVQADCARGRVLRNHRKATLVGRSRGRGLRKHGRSSTRKLTPQHPSAGCPSTSGRCHLRGALGQLCICSEHADEPLLPTRHCRHSRQESARNNIVEALPSEWRLLVLSHLKLNFSKCFCLNACLVIPRDGELFSLIMTFLKSRTSKLELTVLTTPTSWGLLIIVCIIFALWDFQYFLSFSQKLIFIKCIDLFPGISTTLGQPTCDLF